MKKSLRERAIARLNEGRGKELVKAIKLLQEASELIKKTRDLDLSDDSDELYKRAKEELNKLLETLKSLNN